MYFLEFNVFIVELLGKNYTEIVTVIDMIPVVIVLEEKQHI